MARTIIEGLPEKYDATEMVQALEAIVAQLEASQVAPAASAPSELASWPTVPTRLSLKRRHRLGVYSTYTDPRISDPQVVSQGEVVGGIERFEIMAGAQVGPWGIAPLVKVAGPTERHVTLATLVTKIPHRLGRLPEKVICLDAPGETYNRTIKVGGGDLTGAGRTLSEAPLGTELRVDMCFFPIFGKTPEDVERSLRFMVGSTPRPPGFDSYTDGGVGSNLDLPDLPLQFFSDAVTTETSFAGILAMSCWGAASFQYAISGDYATTHTVNPVTGVEDSQAQMTLPCGQDCGVFDFDNWLAPAALPLQAVSDDGLFVFMERGGIQFLLR